MTPARISGVSMLPPWASGTSDERASRLAGATPTVPCIGSSGSSTSSSPYVARGTSPCGRRVHVVHPDHARAAAPGAPAVTWVEVSAPNSGIVRGRRPVARRLDRDEVDREGVAGLGALDVERPGQRVHERELDDLRHQVVGCRGPCRRRRPRVHSSSTVPGWTRRTGATPPNVQASSSAVGSVAQDVHRCDQASSKTRLVSRIRPGSRRLSTTR